MQAVPAAEALSFLKEIKGAATWTDRRLRIPVTAWYMPDGELIEGNGVKPDCEVSLLSRALGQGETFKWKPLFATLWLLIRGIHWLRRNLCPQPLPLP